MRLADRVAKIEKLRNRAYEEKIYVYVYARDVSQEERQRRIAEIRRIHKPRVFIAMPGFGDTTVDRWEVNGRLV